MKEAKGIGTGTEATNIQLTRRLETADRLTTMSKFEEAARILQPLRFESPKNESIETAWAWLSVHRMPYQEAHTTVTRFKEDFPLSGNGPLIEAQLELRFGRALAALEALKAASLLGAAPDRIETLREQALEVALRTNWVDPPTDGPGSLAAARKLYQGRPPESVEEIEEAAEALLSRGERAVNVEYYRASWYGSRKMYKPAISGLKDALVRFPNSSLLSLVLAECLYKTWHFAEAESVLAEVLRLEPDNAKAKQSLFNVSLMRGRFRPALRLLRELARSDVVSELLKK